MELPTDLMGDLAAQLADRHGFTLDVSHLALSGICANCQDDS